MNMRSIPKMVRRIALSTLTSDSKIDRYVSLANECYAYGVKIGIDRASRIITAGSDNAHELTVNVHTQNLCPACMKISNGVVTQ